MKHITPYHIYESASQTGSLVPAYERAKREETKNRVNELKITMYPDGQGVDVDDSGVESIPVITLPLKDLTLNEPASKMGSPESQAVLKQLVASMEGGEEISPILVRKLDDKYQILDGHHRYFATRIVGGDSIKAQIVPPECIEFSQEDYEAES